jgi:hypothetical protein
MNIFLIIYTISIVTGHSQVGAKAHPEIPFLTEGYNPRTRQKHQYMVDAGKTWYFNFIKSLVVLASLTILQPTHRELEKARSASLTDLSYGMAGVYSFAKGLPV